MGGPAHNCVCVLIFSSCLPLFWCQVLKTSSLTLGGLLNGRPEVRCSYHPRCTQKEHQISSVKASPLVPGIILIILLSVNLLHAILINYPPTGWFPYYQAELLMGKDCALYAFVFLVLGESNTWRSPEINVLN